MTAPAFFWFGFEVFCELEPEIGLVFALNQFKTEIPGYLSNLFQSELVFFFWVNVWIIKKASYFIRRLKKPDNIESIGGTAKMNHQFRFGIHVFYFSLESLMGKDQPKIFSVVL
jgi:hypothetical protein